MRFSEGPLQPDRWPRADIARRMTSPGLGRGPASRALVLAERKRSVRQRNAADRQLAGVPLSDDESQTWHPRVWHVREMPGGTIALDVVAHNGLNVA